MSLRLSVLLALAFAVTSAFARAPEPAQRIPIEPFGYQNISERNLLEGASMLTVDYVDNQHLLVTFGVSRLMLRLADCPTDDQDRTVKAVLLELPSGRELAHTEWRFHDVGQYLWNLGDGHFLLRNRDTLTTFSPLQNLVAADPFVQRPFLHTDRRIQALLVSANHDLLTVETTRYKPHEEVDPQAAILNAIQSGSQPNPQTSGQTPSSLTLHHRDTTAPKPDPAPYEISFIRLLHKPGDVEAPFSQDSLSYRTDRSDPSAPGASGKEPAPPTHIVPQLGGRVRTSKAVRFPLTSEGLLEIKSTTRDGVLLDFLSFAGKVTELGDYATSCPPKPTFVSPSEFIVFGCRGSDEALQLAGFNLRGDLMWLTNFSDLQAYPSIVASIPSGRFALSRTTTLTNVFGSETPSADQLTGQEVRVIQTYNGKQLLKVFTSPIQRAGQNFTLSPDGMGLAVIHDNAVVKGDVTFHNTAVEIYRLPSLSGKDQSEVKAEAALAPAPAVAPIAFSIEEIKAALARKPGTEASNPAGVDPDPDSRIVGDSTANPAPASTSATSPASNAADNSQAGSIPASDPAPACANLTDTAISAAVSCPVTPKQKPSPTPAANPVPASTEDQPAPRRKPPTLYEPAPPETSSPPPQ